jgi:hypothetical protein
VFVQGDCCEWQVLADGRPKVRDGCAAVCNRKAEQGRLVSIDLQGTPGLGMWIQVADHWVRRKRIAGRRPSKFTAGHRKGDKGQTNKDESWPYYWHIAAAFSRNWHWHALYPARCPK